MQGFGSRCCSLLAGMKRLFVFWIVVKSDKRQRKRWVNMTQLSSWALTIAKYCSWPFSKCGATDGWTSSPNTYSFRVIQNDCLCLGGRRQAHSGFVFFILMIFAYTLKNIKLPSRKQQFTAAICPNKGCPDYPRWYDSLQPRLIKSLNSTTTNNLLVLNSCS